LLVCWLGAIFNVNTKKMALASLGFFARAISSMAIIWQGYGRSWFFCGCLARMWLKLFLRWLFDHVATDLDRRVQTQPHPSPTPVP
jgi:hypothetical protein